MSKDIDIFVPDPQCLAYLSPRLNSTAEELTSDYVEQAGFLKLAFPEGEIYFVASAPLTENPTVVETLFDRQVEVETSTEIAAEQVWHRGDQITARDIFDLAMVMEKEPKALEQIKPILRERRGAVLGRISARESVLREDFAELQILEYRRSFDECVTLVHKALE